jgi:hypothetical protein
MTTVPDRARPPRGPGRLCVVIAPIALFVGAVALIVFRPRTEHTETVAVVQPTATYVGTARCADCHAPQAALHAQSGHASTFAETWDSDVARRLCGRSAELAEGYGRCEYDCDLQGLQVRMPDRLGDRAFPLDFAVGSGKHAVTFLSLIPDELGNTTGIEHHLSWFRADDVIDLTPGHAVPASASDVTMLGDILQEQAVIRCIGCHTTRHRIDNHRLTDLIPHVQCEACHGPGSEHVAAAQAGPQGPSPRAIARPVTANAEIELCGRCHRLPTDIAPDRLEGYADTLVRFQPVGLLQSRCYTESNQSLKCTTCHDPHAPAGTVSETRHEQTCRQCHSAPHQHPCPVSPDRGCISCHMPAIEASRGTYLHDHWIRIRRDRDTTP